MEKDKRWWLSPCCLDCSNCPIHLRTKEELDYWKEQNVDLDKIRCNGCRSDRKGFHWAPECEILQCCVYELGYEFCAECPDLPCDILKKWGEEYEHHSKAVDRLIEMKNTGIDEWLSNNGYQ